MKFAIVLLAVFGAAFARTTIDQQILETRLQQRIFEDTITNAINSLIAKIAVYDPYHNDEVQTNLLGHDVLLQNVDAAGFSNIRVTHVKLSGLISWTLELSLEASQVTASVEHWKVDGEEFYGDGTAHATINNLGISVTAKVSILGFDVSNVSITPSVGSADVRVTGVYNDEQLSQELSERANDFLNDTINNSQELHDKISQIVQDLIDSLGY